MSALQFTGTWVPVTDLPKKTGIYHAALSERYVYDAWYSEPLRQFEFRGKPLEGVTHWCAPLPHPSECEPVTVCERCKGHGEITVHSGQTPESYCEENIACHDCQECEPAKESDERLVMEAMLLPGTRMIRAQEDEDVIIYALTLRNHTESGRFTWPREGKRLPLPPAVKTALTRALEGK